jgi:hypothetical protein
MSIMTSKVDPAKQESIDPEAAFWEVDLHVDQVGDMIEILDQLVSVSCVHLESKLLSAFAAIKLLIERARTPLDILSGQLGSMRREAMSEIVRSHAESLAKSISPEGSPASLGQATLRNLITAQAKLLKMLDGEGDAHSAGTQPTSPDQLALDSLRALEDAARVATKLTEMLRHEPVQSA